MRLTLKILMVLGMTIAIMIPLLLIRGTISERQAYRAQAIENVSRSSAGAQSFAGPVLVVPYVERVEVEETGSDGKVVRKVVRDGHAGQWTFFPERLDVAGMLVPETRRLGLHEVRVYRYEATAAAQFDLRIPADADPRLPRRIGQPWLSYGIADVRGLV